MRRAEKVAQFAARKPICRGHATLLSEKSNLHAGGVCTLQAGTCTHVTQPTGTSLRGPLQLAFSSEGLRQQDQWKYRAQLRFVIPVFVGLNLPLSFGYGNRSDLLRDQEKTVYGKFGLTFDFAKIVQSLRSQE